MLYSISDVKRRNFYSDLLFKASNYLIITANSLIIKQNKEKQTTPAPPIHSKPVGFLWYFGKESLFPVFIMISLECF